MNKHYFVIFLLLFIISACSLVQVPSGTLVLTPSPSPIPTITLVPTSTSTSVPPLTPTPAFGPSIHTIQGVGHISPLNSKEVQNVHGIVTMVRSDGFYIQENVPDNDVATSEGILVYLEANPKVKIGDEVLVTGVVDEYIPGGSATGNLSITEIKNPKVTKISEGNVVPTPTVIGRGGRLPPNQFIESDNKTFNSVIDGLDFYESMESMLVQVNDAVACGPTNAYKETAVLADLGQDATLRTPRGGIVIRENDYNPERIIIDDLLTILPDLDTGDRFEKPLIGILDYNFGNFHLQVTQRPVVVKGNLLREIVQDAGEDELSIASLNVQNLDPSDGQKRFDDFAALIIKNLKSPDILSLDEIQDNNGPANDAVTDGSLTYKMLIQAILAAGGPLYDFREIAPEPNQDGGEPGGNIRVGFIFRSDRGIRFVDRPGGSATNPVEIKKGTSDAEITISPGRIEPSNSAFNASRKPLIGEFDYRGQRFFLIGLHLNSKSGDMPLFGRTQPPILTSEIQRSQQATVISRFIQQFLEIDPNAKVLVLGDLNDFSFSTPIKILTSGKMKNLTHTLPVEQQYSYVYDGNAEVLDQMVASPALVDRLKYYNFIHVNAEFAAAKRLSDHEPVLARFIFQKP